MIRSGHGNPEASPLCLPVHVSYRMDPEIPVQSARRRGGRILENQDRRSEKEVSGDRVLRTKYPTGPHPSGGQFSSEIQHFESGADHKTKYGEGAVGEVRIHTGAVLTARGDVVGRIFRQHSGLGRANDIAICKASGKRRPRTSEACVGLNAPDVSPGIGYSHLRKSTDVSP